MPPAPFHVPPGVRPDWIRPVMPVYAEPFQPPIGLAPA
jgi:hypothetical protein